MLFLLVYNLEIVVQRGGGRELTFGGEGRGKGEGGVRGWESTGGEFFQVRVGGAMRKFSAGGRSAPVGKTLMVGTRKIFNRKNRHELESFNKIQRTTTISKKICIKLNEFLPIVDKDFRGSMPQIHVYKNRHLCKRNLLHLLSRCFHPANRIKQLWLCSF